jgi:hypothetical protein
MNKPIPKERNERKGYDKILFENHKKRIMNMKPRIDSHYIEKLKKIPRLGINDQIKKRTIINENMQLLTRIYNVKPTLDNYNHISVIRQLQFKKQLSYNERQNRENRIKSENDKLLKSIQNVKPSINLKKLENDFQKHNNIKKMMLLYPS